MQGTAPPEDKRTRVDRALDRVRNNRFAAAAIVLGIGLTALASLTDSLNKLSAFIPSLAGKTELRGQWRSDPFDFYYGPDPQVIMTMTITEVVGDRVVGFVQIADAQGGRSSPKRGMLQGKLEGEKLSFQLESGLQRHSSPGSPYEPLLHSVSGLIGKNEIRFVYEGIGPGVVAFVARKTVGAASAAGT